MSLKPYPHYKNSGLPWLGEVPSHWDQLPGFAVLVEKEIKNNGLKEKTVLSLSYGKIVIKPVEKLHGLVPESFETYQIVGPGDIIIRSTDLQNDKVSLRVGEVNNDGIITSAYLCLRPMNGLHSRFAYLLLHGLDLMKVFYGFGSGLRQNLSWTDFKRLPFFLPQLNEQHQIVHYLDWKTSQINRFINAKKRQIELLKEQKKVIINDAVTGKIDVCIGKPYASYINSGHEWIEKIPNNWKNFKLKRVCSLIIDTEHKTVPFYDNGEFYVVRTSDVRDGVLLTNQMRKTDVVGYNNWTKRATPTTGDILFTREAPAGEACVLNVDIDVCLGQRMVLLRVLNKIALPDFIVLQIYSEVVTKFISSLTQGSTVAHLNMDDIQNIPLVLPSLEVQQQIVGEIKLSAARIDQAIAELKEEIKLINEYKFSLISNTVTGKIDVRDISVPGVNIENEIEVMEDSPEEVEGVDEGIMANE